MTRRCSHCSHNGHNSRTCPNKGVKLFGVRLTDGIRKCASMGNLSHYSGGSSGSGGGMGGGGGGGGLSPQDGPEVAEDGYASEDLVPGTGSGSRERKKGVPWTEEEHRMFLLGLQKLGKGDWRGIARSFVVSRTPTQVASHAQKYFIRQTNATRRKRRSSLFDIIVDESAEASHAAPVFEEVEMRDSSNPLPQPPTLEEECESMESTNSNDAEVVPPNKSLLEAPPCSYSMVFPAYFPPFFPYTIPVWQNYSADSLDDKGPHEIIKPTPIYSKEPIDVNELVGMSNLSIGGESSSGEPMPQLSLKLRIGRDRQSAFHAKSPPSSSDVNPSSGPVHAV